ncbi:MAG: hypothetical protein LBJ12_04350 [Oscillospiraceae bacterium]|jgi:hypothetical protein|nr:hypothetical protein [Oscillospiraceae bacterium]
MAEQCCGPEDEVEVDDDFYKNNGLSSAEKAANEFQKRTLAILESELRADRWLRWIYAGAILVFFIGELWFITNLINKIGKNELIFEPWVIDALVVGVLAEIAVVLHTIAKYLFTHTSNVSDILERVAKHIEERLDKSK